MSLDSSKTARQFLETERAFGVYEIPAPSAPAVPPSAASAAKARALAELAEQYKNCMRCPLSATRTQVVFGTGSADARLMFVGEAPGFDEDREGKPFVGAAGQLLTKII